MGSNLWGMSLREKHGDMMALQTHTIRLMKQQTNPGEKQVENADDAWLPDGGAAQPTGADITMKAVPLPLALQGPFAAAWQLVSDASCTEEQIAQWRCWHSACRSASTPDQTRPRTSSQ